MESAEKFTQVLTGKDINTRIVSQLIILQHVSEQKAMLTNSIQNNLEK